MTILHNISNRQMYGTLCILKVVSPKRSDLVLAANVPNCKAYVLVFYCFHVKTYEIKFTNISNTRIHLSIKIYAIARTVMASQSISLYIPIVGIVVTISPSLSL